MAGRSRLGLMALTKYAKKKLSANSGRMTRSCLRTTLLSSLERTRASSWFLDWVDLLSSSPWRAISECTVSALDMLGRYQTNKFMIRRSLLTMGARTVGQSGGEESAASSLCSSQPCYWWPRLNRQWKPLAPILTTWTPNLMGCLADLSSCGPKCYWSPPDRDPRRKVRGLEKYPSVCQLWIVVTELHLVGCLCDEGSWGEVEMVEWNPRTPAFVNDSEERVNGSPSAKEREEKQTVL